MVFDLKLSQKDLKQSLNGVSERMPALIEILHKEYLSGGIPKVASRLCEIEESWSNFKHLVLEQKLIQIHSVNLIFS